MLQELFVKIGADFNEFEKGMENAQKKLGDFGKKTETLGKSLTTGLTAPIVGLGAAMIANAVKTGEYADRLFDLEVITGMSAEAIQEWQYVAKIAGTDTEAVTSAAQKLTKQLFTMEDGTGKAAEALTKLGLNFNEIENMKADERMNAVITALSGVDDETERARLGTELLGGAWAQIAPIVGAGSEEIARLKEEAHTMGTVMSGDALSSADDFRVKMVELQAQMAGLFNEIGAKLAPVLLDTLMPIIQNDIIPLVVAFAEKIGMLAEWFGGLDDSTKKMILTFIAIVAAIGPVLMIAGKLIAIFSLVLSPIGLIVAAVALLAAGFIYLYTTNETFRNFVNEAWTAIKDAIMSSIEFIVDVINEHFVPVIKKIQEVFTEIFEFIQPYIQEFVEFIQSKLDDLRVFWEENGEQILQAVKNIFEFIVSYVSGAIEKILEVIDFFMPLIKGAFEVAFNFVKDTIDNVFKVIGGIFKVFAGVFTGDWEKVWEGVKDIFGGIFDQIIDTFKAAINLIINGINFITGKISAIKIKIPEVDIPLIGKIGGGSIGFPDIKKIPLLAEGGIVIKPTLAVVGEKTPEAVIPLNRMNDFMGQQPTNIYLDGRKITGTIAPQMVDMIRGRIGSAY